MHNTPEITALNVALCSSLSAFAQQAEGNWMVRGRAISNDYYNGQSEGLPLGGTTKIEADNLWIPEVDITYFFTKNFAA